MTPKPKAPKPRRWAAHVVVDSMTDEEVRQACERLGIQPPRDSRSPIERMVDEACKWVKP